MVRRLVYLTLAALTWYLAGMYRSFPLTALFLAEIGIFILLALQALYFYATLEAGFPSEWSVGEKGRDCRCRVSLREKGLFPVGRVRLTLRLSYGDGRQKTIRHIYGGVEGRCGAELEFFVSPACCGAVLIELAQVRVYDYLALFSIGRRGKRRMTLAVLPAARPLRIVRVRERGAGRTDSGELPALSAAEASPETRELREYQPGDAARSIHWKQSARTGTLWSREYEGEADRLFSLALDFSGGEAFPAERWDAFYEVLSALLLGLLEHAAAVRVQWRDGDQALFRDVRGEADRLDLFPRLYRRAAPLPGAGAKAGRVSGLGVPADSSADSPAFSGADFTDFTLDAALCWRRGSELLYRFSPDQFSIEQEQGIFYI